ncbi:GNAT family N-acetyltransferase [Erythrobacter vulgaris]|uniref:GNAT family N-acetyltransferase n=1 Tax=Qipengyuania vulgaris TaxID=291985 RepID=A0A844XVE2_9SPHN|nr:GNAT family N-acetyltransferase [Qipengyuania vulgaris]MXO48932.1 GNAT family N-acetyltransferase [Qipengyuania vulgaris]
MAEAYSCITYARSRPEERRADAYAQDQQDAAEKVLSRSYRILGRFGDTEFADPFSGWLEPRPGWKMACAEAQQIAREDGACDLVILTANGIGTGDPYLPGTHLTEDLENVRIQVCCSERAGHYQLVSLHDAHARFQGQNERERTRHSGVPIRLPSNHPKGELFFQPDHRRKQLTAYYCNPGHTPLELRWQTFTRRLATDDHWSDPQCWTDFRVPPNSAAYLHSFFQGEPEGEAHWWRFKSGKDREIAVGNILIAPSALTPGFRALRCYRYEPIALRRTDFQWQSKPSLRTQRLRMRNWSPADAAKYARLCNTEEVMRFLGGVQSEAEIAADIDYFSELGKIGLTYWVVERMDDDAFLGFCGAIIVEEEDSPIQGAVEIGWRLSSDVWGHGYAYEAAAEVLRCLFEEMQVKAVVARIDRQNQASQRVAERLGMTINDNLQHAGEGEQVLDVFSINECAYWRTK